MSPAKQARSKAKAKESPERKVKGASERLMTILIAPHVSEKAARVTESAQQYVFRVRTDAFRFARMAQGSFTGMAAADYNRDGLIDI